MSSLSNAISTLITLHTMYDVPHLWDLVCLLAGLLPHSACLQLDMAGASSATMQAGTRLIITPKTPHVPLLCMLSCHAFLHCAYTCS